MVPVSYGWLQCVTHLNLQLLHVSVSNRGNKGAKSSQNGDEEWETAKLRVIIIPNNSIFK